MCEQELSRAEGPAPRHFVHIYVVGTLTLMAVNKISTTRSSVDAGYCRLVMATMHPVRQLQYVHSRAGRGSILLAKILVCTNYDSTSVVLPTTPGQRDAQ